MGNEGKDEEMICGLTVDERDLLMRELNDLPQTMPPRIVWNRIREQAQAEGVDRPHGEPVERIVFVGVFARRPIAGYGLVLDHGSVFIVGEGDGAD